MIKFVLIGLKPLFDFIIYVDWAPAMRDKWRPILFILSISSSFSCSIDQLPPEMPSELPSELFPGLPPELPPELPPALAEDNKFIFLVLALAKLFNP